MQSEDPEHTIIEASSMDSPTGDVLNLTPHDIFVLSGDSGTMVAFRAVKEGALRLDSAPQKPWGSLPAEKKRAGYRPVSIPIIGAPRHYLDPKQFPYTRDSVVHPPIIVAGIVAPHIPQWYSGMVLVPDTGPGGAIRDNKGRIVGVRNLYIVEAADRQK